MPGRFEEAERRLATFMSTEGEKDIRARAATFEREQLDAEISPQDVMLSRQTGMHPSDIEHLRVFSASASLLIVTRCPKRSSRLFYDAFAPKAMMSGKRPDEKGGMVLNKSNDLGLVAGHSGAIEVSDYDLMCVCLLKGPHDAEKIFFSGVDKDNPRSALSPEARSILRSVQGGLKAKFQHGAQDDLDLPPVGKVHHPNLKADERFAAFSRGHAHYIVTAASLEAFYKARHVPWPYRRGRTGDFLYVGLEGQYGDLA